MKKLNTTFFKTLVTGVAVIASQFIAGNASAVVGNGGSGSVSIAALGVAVTQNFDGLGSSGAGDIAATLPGWYIFETGSSTTANNGLYLFGTGSSTTGDAYSFGTTADRALGCLNSGSTIATLGAKFTNSTGATLTSITITYTGEVWRLGVGSGFTDKLDFSYSVDPAATVSTGTYTGVPALTFTTPNSVTPNTVGPINGNTSQNRTLITSTITGLSIPAGASFWIRWSDFDAPSSDNGLAIDDFSISAAGTAPTTITTTATNFGTKCPGSNISVPFTYTGTFSGTFEAQVSDATGAFTATTTGGTIIGTGTGTAGSGIISATLPSNLASGPGYRVRVLNDNPTTFGSDNGSNMIVNTTDTWNGTTSAWATGTNWSCGFKPSASLDAVIPNTGSAPIITTGAQSAKSLTIATGASLAFATAADLLNVAGDLSNNGIVSGDGAVVLNGSTQQNITGVGTIDNLTLNNTAGSAIPSGSQQTLKGTLTLTAGQFNVVSGGDLIVYSDATTTGRVAALGAGASLTGSIQVQRYVPAKTARAFSFLASPVTNYIAFNWQNKMHVTGATDGTGTICTAGNGTADADVKQDNGFDPTVSHVPSFYYYDGSDIGNEWKSITSTTGNTATTGLMVPGTGYRADVRGDRTIDGCNLLDGVTSSVGAVTLSAKGFAASGDIATTVPVAAFDGLTDDNNYTYALVGNPYACEIDFDNATWASLRSSNNLTNAYYVYSPCNVAGTYTSYIDGLSTNNACTGLTAANVIASGQSFFVERHSVITDLLPTTLTINNFFQEGFKTSAHQLGAFKTTNVNDKIRVALNDATGAHIDEFFTRFTSNGTDTYNGNIDASSFGENANYIATAKDDGRYLAISTMPAISGEDTVPVIVYTEAAGAYQLGFSEHQGINGDVLLVDSYLGTVQDIKANPSYNFNVTADAASFGENRFYVVFNFMATSVGNVKVATTLHVYPNPVSNELNVAIANGNYAVRITNAVGAEVYSSNTTVSNSTMHINTNALSTGVYIVEATGSNGKAVAKFVK